MTNKKGKRMKQKGDKTDTMINNKGDKTRDKKKQKADTQSGNKADILRKHLESLTITYLVKYRNHLGNK